MKRSDLYKFQEGLEMAQHKGAKFTYAVTKNKRRVKTEIVDMESGKKPSQAYEKYKKEQEAVNIQFAEKDEGGNPRTERKVLGPTRAQEVYVIPGENDPKSEFSKETDALRKKHDVAVKAHTKKIEKHQEFLKEETDWKPFMIDLDIVPEDISQYVMDRIDWMINDVEKF